MTKEQILSPFEFKSAGKVNTKDALKAMDEYAKQDSIEFAKWTVLNDIEYGFGDEMWWDERQKRWLNDEQLYELYQQYKLKSNK